LSGLGQSNDFLDFLDQKGNILGALSDVNLVSVETGMEGGGLFLSDGVDGDFTISGGGGPDGLEGLESLDHVNEVSGLGGSVEAHDGLIHVSEVGDAQLSGGEVEGHVKSTKGLYLLDISQNGSKVSNDLDGVQGVSVVNEFLDVLDGGNDFLCALDVVGGHGGGGDQG